jgi:hypothetical protein
MRWRYRPTRRGGLVCGCHRLPGPPAYALRPPGPPPGRAKTLARRPTARRYRMRRRGRWSPAGPLMPLLPLSRPGAVIRWHLRLSGRMRRGAGRASGAREGRMLPERYPTCARPAEGRHASPTRVAHEKRTPSGVLRSRRSDLITHDPITRGQITDDLLTNVNQAAERAETSYFLRPLSTPRSN